MLTTLLTLVSSVYAATITVDNTSSTGRVAMFSDLQEAIDAADAGDVIMIKGSATNYGSVTLNKTLTLIGEGYANTINTRQSTIGIITLTSAASGSVLRSLYITYFTGEVTDDLKLINVNFLGNGNNQGGSGLHGENWTLIDCKATTGHYGFECRSYSATFYNCIFIKLGQNNASSSTINLYNCNILVSIYNSQFATFNNCLLPLADDNQVRSDYSTNNVFNNCLFEYEVLTQDTLELSGNELNDCIFQTDPKFVNTTDYQLQEDSPAKDAGSDGTDIGITGGFYPVKALNGDNALTKVDKVFVETSVITPGSPLKLKVSAHQKVAE